MTARLPALFRRLPAGVAGRTPGGTAGVPSYRPRRERTERGGRRAMNKCAGHCSARLGSARPDQIGLGAAGQDKTRQGHYSPTRRGHAAGRG